MKNILNTIVLLVLSNLVMHSQNCSDCCLTDVQISSAFHHINGNYQSSTWIKSNAIVEAVASSDIAGAPIDNYSTIYEATDYIELEAGFEATGTVNFITRIEICNVDTTSCNTLNDYSWTGVNINPVSYPYYYYYYYDYFLASKCVSNGLCLIIITDLTSSDYDTNYYRLNGTDVCYDNFFLQNYYVGCDIITTNCINLE